MNRIELAEKNDREWFRGKAFPEDSLDSEYAEIARRFLCGDALTHGSLSNKQRALVMLTALAADQTWKPLPKYVQAALDMGVRPEEIKETFYQCAPYIGLEKVQGALEEANKTFQAAGITQPLEKQSRVTEESRLEKGIAVQKQIFGAENINAMRENAPQETKHIQDYLSAYCFGDFYTRGTLDLKMRELITFCAICSIGGCEPQAKAHAGANINVGNTREMLVEAMTVCLPLIGFPRTLNAISCIDAVTNR